MKQFCFVIIVCLFFSQCVTYSGKKIIDDTVRQKADIPVKKLICADRLQLPDNGGKLYHPYLLMMRTDNNNIVFISSKNYLDIKDMSMKTIEIPTELPEDIIRMLPEHMRWWGEVETSVFPARPPYSNNKVHIKFDGDGSIFLYDISNNSIDVESYLNSYRFGHPDSDYYFEIFSPEYWLTAVGSGIWLVQSNGTIHENPLEYIKADFSGTVFDNDYIMETIRNINKAKLYINTRIIITKDDIHFASAREHDQNGDTTVSEWYGDGGAKNNALYYFINRMDTYFDINIQDIFQFGDVSVYDIHYKKEVGIYTDGFFIHNGAKLLLLDIKNHTTALYAFDEYTDFSQNYSYSKCKLFITNDAKTLLLRAEAPTSGYGGDIIVIYKYEL